MKRQSSNQASAKLRREILLFAVGGGIGLAIDASLVQALVGWAHANPYIARVFSFLVAATVTWWWNRRRTFAERSSGRCAQSEWVHWMGLMSVGALINYAIYVAFLLAWPWLQRWPALPTAAGSAVAALVNFASARGVLFRGAKTSA